jgi:MFS family permease
LREWRDRPWSGLLAIGLGVSIAPMDFAVNVALPAITAAFTLDVPGIRWVVVCYVITYASLMLAFGRLGDVAGHRRVFRAGLVVGAFAFAACGLAPSYPALLVARMLQGVATALVLSCGPALAVSLVDEQRRTWALSRYAMMGAVAGILGPMLGGLGILALGWSGVFWFRVPVALLALLLVSRLPGDGASAAASRTYDRTGAVLLAAGLASALAGPVLWPLQGGTLYALVAGGGGLVLLGVVALREHRGSAPILPRAALGDPAFVLSNLASVTVHFTAFAIPLLVPYHLARIGGHGAGVMGALLAMSTVGLLAGSMLAPRIVHALGQRPAALLGAALVVAAQFAIGQWPMPPSVAAQVAALLLHGVGLGLFQVSHTDLVVATLPRDDRGVAGSLTMLTRTVGIVLAAVALGSALQHAEADHLAAGYPPDVAFHAAFGSVFAGSGLLLAGLLVLTCLRRGVWTGSR